MCLCVLYVDGVTCECPAPAALPSALSLAPPMELSGRTIPFFLQLFLIMGFYHNHRKVTAAPLSRDALLREGSYLL